MTQEPSREEDDADAQVAAMTERVMWAAKNPAEHAKKKMEEELREVREQRRLQEKDPLYWRGLYERLLKQVEETDKERKRTHEMWFGAVICVGGFLLVCWLVSLFL